MSNTSRHVSNISISMVDRSMKFGIVMYQLIQRNIVDIIRADYFMLQTNEKISLSPMFRDFQFWYLGRKYNSIFFWRNHKEIYKSKWISLHSLFYVNFMSIYVNSLLDINLHLI